MQKQTLFFKNPPSIPASYAVVGNNEGNGPLAQYFDLIADDALFGESCWEKAESKFLKTAIGGVIKKSGLSPENINFIFAGDLLNQCSSSHFAGRNFAVPFFGIFGACSTMAEGLCLGAMTVDGGFAQNVVCATSSHFCSAEKQFRFPLDYGGQRPPTAQWTVTGGAAAIVTKSDKMPYITAITPGKIIDMGITDANNMGAAMAPAAADTIAAHFNDTGLSPQHYDLIVTGDLGKTGSEALKQMLLEKGIDISENHADCGCMIFDFKTQDVHSGGSGCCCGGATLCGKLLGQIKDGIYSKILFVATGALMNTSTCLQGESIPCIAHAVTISREK